MLKNVNIRFSKKYVHLSIYNNNKLILESTSSDSYVFTQSPCKCLYHCFIIIDMNWDIYAIGASADCRKTSARSLILAVMFK